MCSRCVRFTREISGTSELMVTDRGGHEEIDVLPGFPLDNNLSGNVVDLCPVGALGDKDFLYQQRVWFLRRHRAFAPAARPAARSGSKRTRTAFIGSSRARTRTSTSGGSATKAVTAIRMCTATAGWCSRCDGRARLLPSR